jgi:hypothetical protein
MATDRPILTNLAAISFSSGMIRHTYIGMELLPFYPYAEKYSNSAVMY